MPIIDCPSCGKKVHVLGRSLNAAVQHHNRDDNGNECPLSGILVLDLAVLVEFGERTEHEISQAALERAQSSAKR